MENRLEYNFRNVVDPLESRRGSVCQFFLMELQEMKESPILELQPFPFGESIREQLSKSGSGKGKT